MLAENIWIIVAICLAITNGLFLINQSLTASTFKVYREHTDMVLKQLWERDALVCENLLIIIGHLTKAADDSPKNKN